nr:hypothetical protein CFP56_50375 [Quercus suber]
MSGPFWTIGCLSGASAIALGAFGAHGLRARGLEERSLNNWATAAQYQIPWWGGLCESTAHALARTAAGGTGGAAQRAGQGPVHGGDGGLLGQSVLSGAGQGAVPVDGARDAAGRHVFDRGVGGVGGHVAGAGGAEVRGTIVGGKAKGEEVERERRVIQVKGGGRPATGSW